MLSSFLLAVLIFINVVMQCCTLSKMGRLEELSKRIGVCHEMTTLRAASVSLEAIMTAVEVGLVPASLSTQSTNRMNVRRHRLGM